MNATIDKLINIARNEQGLKEVPPGSNQGPDIAKYAGGITGYTPGDAWCVAFVHWCLTQVNAGYIPDTLSVATFYNCFYNNHPDLVITSGPVLPGDIALRVNMNGYHDYMGIVTIADGSGVCYISGNTTDPSYTQPPQNGQYNDFFCL